MGRTASCVASIVIGIAARRQRPSSPGTGWTGRWASWVAPALLTIAICGLHFTAMGAVTLIPDPTIAVPGSNIDDATLAIAVTAVKHAW